MKKTLILWACGVIFFLIFSPGNLQADLPDLAVTGITHKPTAPRAGDRIGIKVVVANKGQVSSAPCKLRFKIGGESQPRVFDVPAMAPNKAHDFDRQFRPNKAGSYNISAFVDCRLQLEEIKESNNKKTIHLIVRRGYPDLQVKSIKVNSSCNIEVTVVNKGPGRIPDRVWINPQLHGRNSRMCDVAFLSHNKRILLFDLDPGRRLQPPGGSVTWTVRFSRWGRLTRICVKVDYAEAIKETNERNNGLCVNLTCIRRQKTPSR